MALKEVVAKNLKHLRVKAGLTQAQLSERSKINIRHLSQLENRPQNITVDTIERLAKGLGVPPSLLFEGADWREGQLASKLTKAEIPGVEAALRLLRGYLSSIKD